MNGQRCGNCDKRLRAGSTRRVFVTSDAGFERMLVCSECFRKALPLLATRPGVVAPLCPCGHEVARFGAECVARLERQVRELSAANVALKQVRKAVGATCGRDPGLCTLADGHDGECLHDRWVCECGDCDNFRRAEETHNGGPIP